MTDNGPPASQVGTHCPHCGEKFEGMFLIPTPENALVPTRNFQSEIDKLGLGAEVVRLKGSGLTNEDIAMKLGFTEGQIAYWLANYRTLPPDKRIKVHQRSIFNVADELQTHYSNLLSMWKEADELDNKDLKLRVLQESRHYMELSGKLVEKLEAMKNDEAYKNAVLDILDTFSPGAKAQALKKIAEFKQGINLLKPL